MKEKVLVSIIMGSDSDIPIMKEAADILDNFSIPYEVKILSAHRSPEATHAYAKAAQRRGIKIIIAGAGGAAHLAGVIASLTPLPVIGVPIKGLDALYSTVQMPPGVPVATVGIDRAQNAGLLAVQILAVGNSALLKKFIAYKRKLARTVLAKSKAYAQKISGKSS